MERRPCIAAAWTLSPDSQRSDAERSQPPWPYSGLVTEQPSSRNVEQQRSQSRIGVNTWGSGEAVSCCHGSRRSAESLPNARPQTDPTWPGAGMLTQAGLPSVVDLRPMHKIFCRKNAVVLVRK